MEAQGDQKDSKPSTVRWEPELHAIRGRIQAVTHYSPVNHFSVLMVDNLLNGKRVMVLGSIANPAVGQTLHLEGLRYGYDTLRKRYNYYVGPQTQRLRPEQLLEQALQPASPVAPAPRPIESIPPAPETSVAPASPPARAAGAKVLSPAFALSKLPCARSALQSYLSALVPGLGSGMTSKMLDAYGEGGEYALLADLDAERVDSGPAGSVMGRNILRATNSAWAENPARHRAMIALRSLGLYPKQAEKALLKAISSQGADKDPLRAAIRICQHPYRLSMLDGIGFQTADRAAQVMGIDGSSPLRIAAGAREAMAVLGRAGHTAVQLWELADEVSFLLNPNPKKGRNRSKKVEDLGIAAQGAINPVEIAKVIWHRGETEGLCFPLGRNGAHTWVSTIKNAQSEKMIARCVADALAAPVRHSVAEVSDEQLDAASGLGKPLHPNQRAAIRTALARNIAVITGGPGCGKTTILKTLVTLLEAEGLRVQLAAPYGCAAKRLATSTGATATTVHRALEAKGIQGFARGPENPLDADVLMLDEFGTLDAAMVSNVMQALARGTRLIIIGDQDQLPSIGPGAVLADLIASGYVPVSRLTFAYRQAGDSGNASSPIADLARNIRDGLSDIPRDADPEKLKITQHRRGDQIADEAISRILTLLDQGVAPSDIVVLSPMLKGKCGVHALNARIQRFLNPDASRIGVKIASERFRGGPEEGGDKGVENQTVYAAPGDRVMHLTNDMATGLTNGDVGTVLAIERDRSLTVDFGLGPITLSTFKSNQLQLSYSMTIHKSQGSEYRHAIIVLAPEHKIMWRRPLAYTGISRAKECLHLIGDLEVLRYAVHQTQDSQRRTLLQPLLLDEIRSRHPHLIRDLDTVDRKPLSLAPIEMPKELMRA